jgi:hypothetical protein
MDLAFSRLRHHARSHNLRLAEIAANVVSGTLTIEGLDPSLPPCAAELRSGAGLHARGPRGGPRPKMPRVKQPHEHWVARGRRPPGGTSPMSRGRGVLCAARGTGARPAVRSPASALVAHTKCVRRPTRAVAMTRGRQRGLPR